ncbi:carbon-nitrogen hydrolase family protein [Desulfosarcina ovata]|uniref:Carbon-nitrogen hydrolase n=1 Tax=Desulfosarcina ovata subsp. ovata TaxID=2752305 RepID=A0A5K8AFG1_9BACT|nr:carbon-nitrogen hydrolase family protein [Desulfosarcina ovata]BBO91279.1 carbon-nitrogen hydrolase [Desulfosarcina ovata subsp. ovata]
MERFVAAAIQLNSKDNVAENLAVIKELVDAATGDGAKLIVLPEYANYLADENKLKHAETLDGPTMATYRELARTNGIYLNCGSFLEKSNDPKRSYNTSVLISPNGEIIDIYRKIHLFDVSIDHQVNDKESDSIVAGDKSVVARTPLLNIGLTICYDLRFPELFQALTDKGANLIAAPAAFTLFTGKDHWEPLLRARAIENEVFVIAAGQWGAHPENKSCFGSSMIIDPWGTVMAKASEGVGFITAPIDLQLQAKVRAQIPNLQNRRHFS